MLVIVLDMLQNENQSTYFNTVILKLCELRRPELRCVTMHLELKVLSNFAHNDLDFPSDLDFQSS